MADADLARMTAELFYLREDARALGEPFLVYLIGMAAAEAERLGAKPKPEAPKPQLAFAAGEAEKPGG